MVKVHTFIAQNRLLQKLSEIEGFKSYISNEAGTTIVSGLEIDEDYISAILLNLNLPYVDYTTTIKYFINDNMFKIPKTYDMFLGTEDPCVVDLIQIGNNVYPFPGIPRVLDQDITIMTNKPLEDGLKVHLRRYSYDVRRSVQEEYWNKYCADNNLLYNHGEVVPAMRDIEKKLIPMRLGDINTFKRKNNNTVRKYISGIIDDESSGCV
jgi:hypothetical protein